MNYRLMAETEYDKVIELCKSKNIEPPKRESTIFVAVSDDGEIQTVLGIRKIILIEPMVSKNSIASVKLFKFVVDIAKQLKLKAFYCFSNPETEKLYNDTGFISLWQNKIFMRKDL